MNKLLPATPVETLEVSPPLAAVISIFHFLASLFGFWKRPRRNAAANFENMSFLDKIYWTYKSKKIIKEPGKGVLTGLFHKGFGYRLRGAVQKNKTITCAAAGDLIKNPLLAASQERLYAHIAPLIFHRDFSTANLESLLSISPGDGYVFSSSSAPALHCSPGQFSALTEHQQYGYSLLNLANNHSLDEGVRAAVQSREQLLKKGTLAAGINKNPGEYEQALVIEKEGIKMGIISGTFGLNGKEIPRGYEYAVNVFPFHKKGNDPRDVLSLMEKHINYCRQRGCAVIIAHLHWGHEYELFPRQSQIDLAHEIIEAGVDVILSHHPHVIGPYEIYTPRRAPHKKALITYSLGNLTSNYGSSPLTLSTILHFSLFDGIVEGKSDVFIDDIEFIPVVQKQTVFEGEPVVEVVRLADMNHCDSEIADIIRRVFGVTWKQ